ncbi:hypothetical protein C0585_02780 [Candidatus Woesearchaeota archaeon]|nr:MAG: hypothetical protein C0585_02780 [Candidatus Woesearchaeota archaeon]
MGIMDVFKKKEENFDDLLKEPEGGSWDSNQLGGNLGSNPDPLLGSSGTSPFGNDMGNTSDFTKGIPPENNFNSEVMGLPNQSSNSTQGYPSDGSEDILGNNGTSASSLGLDTNYPSSPPNMRSNDDENNHDERFQASNNEFVNNQNEAQNPNQNTMNSRDMDLIISKLDLIKSTLQHLDSRISNIEQKLYEEKRDRW